MSKSTFLAYGVLLLALWGRTAWLVAIIHHDIPLHFNWDGRPDRWGPPSNLLLLCGIVTALTAGLLALGAAMPGMALRGPDWINMPRKKRFLALPPEARARAVLPLVGLLKFLPLPLIALFLWIVEESGRRGMTYRSEELLPWTPMTLPLVAIAIAVGVCWGRSARAVDAEAAAASAAAVAAPPAAR
jgi:hypothetical protein